jgi:hypothetical protein
MAANLIAQTESSESKGRPDTMPLRLRFQVDGDRVALNDVGPADAFLIDDDGTVALSDAATTGKRIAATDEKIVALD